VHAWSYAKKPARVINELGSQIGDAPDVSEFQREYRMSLRQAKCFMMSDDVTRLAVEYSHHIEEIASKFALGRVPFPTTWVEWDHHVKVSTSMEITGFIDGSRGHIRKEDYDLTGVPKHMGFLLTELDAVTGTYGAVGFADDISYNKFKMVKPQCSPDGPLKYVIAPEGPNYLTTHNGRKGWERYTGGEADEKISLDPGFLPEHKMGQGLMFQRSLEAIAFGLSLGSAGDIGQVIPSEKDKEWFYLPESLYGRISCCLEPSFFKVAKFFGSHHIGW